MNNSTNPTAITPCINEIIGQSDLSPALNKRCTEGARVTRNAATANIISHIIVINPIRDISVK
ncbi:MAG: hypothetical protein WCC17_16245 [Candidatus Nitrosopolaris sp.]